MDAKDLLPATIEFDEPSDPHLDAVAELEQAAQFLDLETWIVNKLRHCERELTVNLPIVRDDGSPSSVTAFRMQHTSWRGPSFGPVSLSPNAHLSSVRTAAMSATWQAALLELPVGGAAGAVICDSEALSERELRQLTRDYVYGLRGMLGRHSDVITPSVGCNEQIMAWMLDAHAQTVGRMERGVVTGVPVALAGLPCTVPPVARGVLAVLRHVLANTPRHGINESHATNRRVLAGQRVSIQGFGSIGAPIAKILYDNGAIIVAAADISGGVRNTNGLNIQALIDHVRNTGVVFGFPESEPARNAEILECECDVLVTAATERQITANVAEHIEASVVAEATRSAITRGADSVLRDRGVTVIPELLTTSGALVGSFLEWQQAERCSPFSAEEVDCEIERRVARACDTVFDYASTRKLSLHYAATAIALDRTAREMRLRR